jgi:hypothetical protein
VGDAFRLIQRGYAQAMICGGTEAAYMGAANIILVGADCGAFDNASRIADYPDPNGHLHYGLWTRSLEAMARRLRILGVGVHSLNPWVTPRLEGHRYETEVMTING